MDAGIERGVTMSAQSNTIDIPVERRRDGKPKRREVVEAVIKDARAAGVDCEESTAYSLIRYLDFYLKFIERYKYKDRCYVSELYLENLLDVLKAVIPNDDAAPVSGSAYELICRFLMADGGRTLDRVESRNLPEEHCVLMVYEY